MGLRQLGLGPWFAAVGRMKMNQYLAIEGPARGARIFHWGDVSDDVIRHCGRDGTEMKWYGVSYWQWFVAVGRKPLAGKVDVVLR